MAWVWIEGITLGAGEEVDEVAEGVNGMGLDRIMLICLML